ncbi:MAG: tetratricopeptide repeat protein, partial [Bacteroidetes bacterium]|nr:tetratricopeptide repeat protein [Bacteroidota bacterium]
REENKRDTVTFMVHKDVKKHLEKGKQQFDTGDIRGALSHYKIALSIDPECALVHFNLGFAFYESQDHSAAEQSYQRAIELEPNCSLFLEHLAKLRFEVEEYAAAIRLFEQAMAPPVVNCRSW